MKTIPVMLTALSVCAAASYLLDLRHKSELAQLQAQVSHLSSSVEEEQRRAIERSTAVLGRLTQAAAATPGPSAVPLPAEEARKEAGAAPAPFEPRDVAAHIETAFVRQPVDQAWAATAQKELRDQLAQTLPTQAEVRALECRGSLCRLETRYRSAKQVRDFVSTQPALWKGASVTLRVDDGTDEGWTTVSYLAREGTCMPPMAPGAP